MSTTTITCSACLDTGWDKAFDSPCGQCGLGQNESSDDALRAAFAEAEERFSRSLNELDELVLWLGEQKDNDFAQSLAAQYANRRRLSDKQIAAARRLRERSADTKFRWTKHDGFWVIAGPVGHEGEEVTVTKASGQEVQVQVDRQIGTLSGKAIYSLLERESNRIEDGFYYVKNGGLISIYKIQTSSNTGRQYGKQLVGTSFNYVGREPFKLNLQKLDKEAAAEFGHLYGVCARCGRTLTDEGSIEAGIGPVCAKQL